MSRNYAILEKSGSQLFAPAGRYSDLIARFFQTPAAVAIVSRGDARICEDIAGELAAAGKRVIIVSVATLLRLNPVPVPHPPAYLPGRRENIWLWPAPDGAKLTFFKSRDDSDPVKWLEALRLNFEAVLLDCPAPGTTPGSAEIAALADAAILIAEAGVTTKLEIRQDCQLLRSKGVKLAGSILTPRT